MKKFYLFVALLASWAATIEVSAQQQKVFVVNGDTLSEYDHVCLPHDGNSTITVKFVKDNLANQNAEFTYYWQSLGDLEKVSENNADSSATFRSTNLGKGAGQGICGNTDTISETLHIASVQFSIKSETGRRYIDVFTTPEVLEDVITDSPIVYYEWFMNDSLADEAVDAYETKVLKTFTGTIRLVVTQGNGCKQSATITIGQNARNNIKSRAFQDNTEHMTMVISPNPVNSLLNVIFPYDAERSIVRVYDINGKLVFRQVTSEKQLDIATTNFPSGMYTLLLNQDGEPFSATFIVQH